MKQNKDAEPKCSLWRRLKTNHEYRRKFQLTCAVCCSYVTLGFVIVQIGTALPDLQILVRIDLETASWLFTAWSIGYIVGSLVSGVAYDRWNRLSYMAFSSIGCAIASMLLPWSPSFPIMLVFRVVTGLFCGAVDTGVNTIVPSIWGNKAGPFMQALYLSYTIGGIVCPLLTRPFMTTHINEETTLGRTDEKELSEIAISNNFNKSADQVVLIYNASIPNLNESIVSSLYVTDLPNATLGEIGKQKPHIHLAFIITGVLTALTAVPYCIMSYLGKYDVKAKDNSASLHEDVKTNPRTSKYRSFIIIFCICAVNLLYAATEDGIGAFLVSFCLYQLQWDKTRAVILMALYWSSSCLGGLIAIFIVRRLELAKMTFTALTIWMSSFLGALVCCQFQFYNLVWLFIPVSGMCMVVIIPNVISWTEAYVCDVSGKVSSLLMMSTGIGIATNPPVIGYLMEKYSILCFLYVLSIESLICTLFFICAYFILHCCSKTDPVTKSLEIEINGDDLTVKALAGEPKECIPSLIESQKLLLHASDQNTRAKSQKSQ